MWVLNITETRDEENNILMVIFAYYSSSKLVNGKLPKMSVVKTHELMKHNFLACHVAKFI